MPGTNQFVALGVGGSANTLTPTAYAALTALLANGFQSGVAPSNQFNTAFRQVTTMAAALGQLIADQGVNAMDDGSVSNLKASIKSALDILYTPGNLGGAPFYSATSSVPLSEAGKLITVYGNSGNVTLTLPTPVGNAGKCFRFYNNSSYTATLSTPAGSFAGTGSAVIQSLCQSVVVSDGASWIFIGGAWAGNNAQSWSNVTGSRSNGTTYYNTTGSPIQVFVESASGSTGVITVGSTSMEFVQGAGSPRASIAVLVPPGVGYSVTNTFTNWYELR